MDRKANRKGRIMNLEAKGMQALQWKEIPGPRPGTSSACELCACSAGRVVQDESAGRAHKAPDPKVFARNVDLLLVQ